jgi:hypothetical protein
MDSNELVLDGLESGRASVSKDECRENNCRDDRRRCVRDSADSAVIISGQSRMRVNRVDCRKRKNDQYSGDCPELAKAFSFGMAFGVHQERTRLTRGWDAIRKCRGFVLFAKSSNSDILLS